MADHAPASPPGGESDDPLTPSPAAPPRQGLSDSARPTGLQASFEDMGTPLRETTFVVIDLETTGGAPGAHAIT